MCIRDRSGRCPESPTTVPITHEERLAVTYVASRRAPTATDNVACGRAVVPWLFTRPFYHRDPEDAHEFLRALFSEGPRLNALAQVLDTPILRCSVCGSERLAAPELFTQLGLALRHEDHAQEKCLKLFVPSRSERDLHAAKQDQVE